MPSPELSTTLILGEIILIETVFIIAVSVYFFLRTKKKSLKLKASLESFLDDEQNRLSRLSETLKKPGFIDDEKYNTILQTIISEENLFYKHLINTFYHSDKISLDFLSTEIQKITRPCAELILAEGKPDTDEVNDKPVIDEDDSIDELLSDDEDIEVDIAHDPVFDLSEPTEITAEPPTEELVETSIENDEIAEIPSDLLTDTPPTARNKNDPKNIAEKNKPDKDSSESESEK